MRRTIHVCQSVSGAIRHWTNAQWKQVALDNGITPKECRDQFHKMMDAGVKVIPLNEPCEGFSYVDGCPGHAVEDIPNVQTVKGE